MTDFPECAQALLMHRVQPSKMEESSGPVADGSIEPCEASPSDADLPLYERYASICHSVSSYLERDVQDCWLPEKFIHRFWVMDIVKPEATNSCCFTKRFLSTLSGSSYCYSALLL